MFDDFIAAHGGLDGVAAALKVPVNTVRVWRSRGFIPRGRWPDVVESFEGVTLTQLREIEAAKPSTDAAA